MLPPEAGMAVDEEKEMRAEYEEAKRNPLEEYADHKEDVSAFEICLINKDNSGLILDAHVFEGNIQFSRVWHVKEQALNIAQLSPVQRRRTCTGYRGPEWRFLSEPLQAALTEYLYAVGLRPEIALAVEYLSWNSEHRLYLSWMRRVYKHFLEDD